MNPRSFGAPAQEMAWSRRRAALSSLWSAPLMELPGLDIDTWRSCSSPQRPASDGACPSQAGAARSVARARHPTSRTSWSCLCVCSAPNGHLCTPGNKGELN